MRKEKHCKLALLGRKVKLRVGSVCGSASKRKSDPDPDRYQNDADPKHCKKDR
jgi:hypothetical protein